MTEDPPVLPTKEALDHVAEVPDTEVAVQMRQGAVAEDDVVTRVDRARAHQTDRVGPMVRECDGGASYCAVLRAASDYDRPAR